MKFSGWKGGISSKTGIMTAGNMARMTPGASGRNGEVQTLYRRANQCGYPPYIRLYGCNLSSRFSCRYALSSAEPGFKKSPSQFLAEMGLPHYLGYKSGGELRKFTSLDQSGLLP
jgi:hypothetical protein